MSENCNHQCGSCGEECAEREEQKVDFSAKLNEMSDVKKVIGVVSGKGGVGKSLVTSLLAVTLSRRGLHTAILDADITGPSIPKAFGLTEKAQGTDNALFPVKTKTGIDVMSVNLLLPDESDPVVFRGPIIAGTVKQFWSDVIWSGIDYMLVDMPPGTGDVPLTVFQSLPVDGIIVVASPQELVSMIVTKAVKMANMMHVPIIGLIENMSYFKCPDNGIDYKIFGDSHIDEIAKEHDLEVLARLPIDPKFAALVDRGMVELFEGDWLEGAADAIEAAVQGKGTEAAKPAENKKMEGNTMKIAVASEGNMVTEHFGHCVNFNIFEAEGTAITKSESIENPGHRPGFLPNFLNDLGVNVIISGGMGGGAIEIFNEKGIEVILGAGGDAKAAAEAYLRGELESTGSVCHDHIHEHGEGCGGGCGH